MRIVLLLCLLSLAGCNRQAVAPASRQIRIVGATAALPFTANIAERYVLGDATAVAPLVQAAGDDNGIARFCGGMGASHPDIVATTRGLTTGELARCKAHGVGVAAIPFGWSALVLVARPDTPAPAITRAALVEAVTTKAPTWHAIDPQLAGLPIDLRGPVDLAPLARPRDDGAYRGYGANADLVVAAVAAKRGAIGIVPYAYALAHRDTVRMLPLDGIAPDPASIASGRYPWRLPLILNVKPGEAGQVPGLRPLLGLFATSLAPGGAFAEAGLIPLDPAMRADVARRVAAL